ncbi:unnamed protein product [Closterium sp. NIES-54]
MASLRVLSFDPEGRPVAFDTWHDDLQLYLLSDFKDSVSLFDHVSGAAPAPLATADVLTRSQWLSRDATARLAIRNHLPATECAHFGEQRTAQALYDAVVALYSSPATAAIGRLLLPYLFPELSAFATVADLVTHLRTSDTRYRAAVPAEDYFLTLDPTSLTVALLEQHLLAAETSAVAVGAARGTPRSPFFEGCCPSPLSSSFASADAADVSVPEFVGAALTSAKRRNSKGKGGRGSGGGSGGGGGGSGSGSGGSGRGGGGGGGGGGSGTGGGGGGSSGGGGGSRGSGGSGGGGTSGGRSGPQRGGRGGAAAVGVSASSTPPGTAPAEALHTFTLDSGASRCFFRDSTTLNPLPAPVPVRLADPSKGPVVSSSSTVLPYPAVPSGSLSGLHLPSFSTNLVSASGQVPASCSCRLVSHQTLLWHHRLGHPSLPRLRGMHSRLLVSGLPRSLPPLPPSPAPPCLPCVKGRQRAAPHSSSFPPTSAPLLTLHMDVWGPARVIGQGRERYFLLVVDDYTRYTTVFPLHSKGEVSARFDQDLPVLRLHSNRGGEFSSDLLRDFCRGEGITQSFTLPDSPQQNGIVERCIGLVMEVARTSMIHAAAPHFLWTFAVRYVAHQLNLWSRVSLPETSPILHWTGKVGDASVFRFYHPTSRRVLPSHDVMFDESVPFYRLFPYRSAPPPPPPLFLAPGAASGGAASGGAELDGAGSEGAGSGGAEPEGVEPRGAESEGAESGGAAGASPQLSSQQLCEWLVQRAHRRSGALGAGGPGDTKAGGAAITTGAGDPTEPGAAGAGGAGAGVAGVGGSGTGGVGAAGARVGGTSAGGAGCAGAGAVDPGAGGVGGTVRPRPYFVPLLQQVLDVPSSTGLPPPFLCPPPDQSQPPLQPASPLPIPSPYSEPSGGLTERHEPTSRPVSPVRTTRRAPRLRPPPLPGTHTMALCPSSVPLRVPLPAPPEVPDLESDRASAARPTVPRLLANAVTDPSFESAAASALVAELLDFAAACCLDYATDLVAECACASPPSVGGECALGTDVLEDRQEDFECLAAAVPRFSSMLLAP